MTKEEIIGLWNEMFNSKKVKKEFKGMLWGRCDKIGDGWRSLILEIENVYVKITLERNPAGHLIYSGDYRFHLDKDEFSEQMCIDFDKRGTLYDGTEISIDRIRELL